MRAITKGSTDQSVVIRIVDSGDGTPETGVTSATSGLDLKYRREGAATANLTESDLSALTDAHSDGGMLHIGAGYYRVDVPDAAFASGANGVLIFGTVTGMVVIGCYVHLVDYNPQDGVRLGLTALPNAAAGANSGLLTCTSANVLPTDSIVAASLATDCITAAKIAADAIGASELASGAVTEIRDAITGGAYALATDANGRIRIVDGTGAGELDTSSGTVTLTDGSLSSAKFATGAITAGVIAADAIGASELAADAVAEIADQVWDEVLSGHLTGGSTGAALNAAGSAGDPWSTALPGAYTSGTAGKIVGDNLNATVSSRSSHAAADIWSVGTRTLTALGFTLAAGDLASDIITAAKIATGAIDADAMATDAVEEIRNAITGGAYALATDANGRIRVVDGTGAGEIDTTSGAIANVTNVANVTGNVAGSVGSVAGNVTGSVGSLAAQAKADVNAEVVDAISADTYAEPGQGAPGATISLAAKMGYLYKAWRNKHDSTSALYRLYADDGSTVDQKASQADDGTTYSRGEVATGP